MYRYRNVVECVYIYPNKNTPFNVQENCLSPQYIHIYIHNSPRRSFLQLSSSFTNTQSSIINYPGMFLSHFYYFYFNNNFIDSFFFPLCSLCMIIIIIILIVMWFHYVCITSIYPFIWIYDDGWVEIVVVFVEFIY